MKFASRRECMRVFFQVVPLVANRKSAKHSHRSFYSTRERWLITWRSRIRAAAWRGLSGTHDRFTTSRKTILISTHSAPSRPSLNNAPPRAQQAIQAHSICISTPRYPLILLPHLNHYTFRSVCSVHLPSVRARLSSSRFRRTDAPKSLALVPFAFAFRELSNCRSTRIRLRLN